MQAAARKVASNTFAHVLDLDVNFHLNTQSGSLSKVLDRGIVDVDHATFTQDNIERTLHLFSLGSTLWIFLSCSRMHMMNESLNKTSIGDN